MMRKREFSVCVLIITVVAIAFAYAVDERRLPAGQTKCFDAAGSNPHDISNNNAFDIFVPNNTSAEWTAFLNHLPAGVTKQSKSSCTGCGLGNITAYNVIDWWPPIVAFSVQYQSTSPCGTGVRVYIKNVTSGSIITNSYALVCPTGGGPRLDVIGYSISAAGHDVWLTQYNSTCEGNPSATFHVNN